MVLRRWSALLFVLMFGLNCERLIQKSLVDVIRNPLGVFRAEPNENCDESTPARDQPAARHQNVDHLGWVFHYFFSIVLLFSNYACTLFHG